MNAACEPSGSVRTQLVSAGGIVPMLAVLDPSQRRGLSDVAVVRAAGVLSRAATVADAMPIFQARSTLERLIQAVGKTGIKDESLADELHAHVVRIVAATVQSVELVTMFAELGGIQKLLSLLPEPRFVEVKTREHAARVTAAKARDARNANMIGNLATVLAKCVTDPAGAASSLVVAKQESSVCSQRCAMASSKGCARMSPSASQNCRETRAATRFCARTMAWRCCERCPASWACDM